MTSVPMPVFGDAGFSSPTELENLAGVLADFNDAFGGNLNLDLSTPQGQLATSFAAVISAFNDLFVDFTNQVDPAFASGRMQDALGQIYYMSRIGATPTTVTATITGKTGLVLPVGSLAKATDGTVYQTRSEVTIPLSGSVDAQFAALVTGPIACPSGTLTSIYRTVVGWDSVYNSAPGVPGRTEESRSDFEKRRGLSVAANASGILPAIRGAVMAVPGVGDAYVTENNTGSSVTTGGQTLVAHSIYVCVLGGADQDVAKAIWSRKSGGCDYSGSTTISYYDEESGAPPYTVKFQRPTSLPIDFAVTLGTGPGIPGDVAQRIEAAIAALFPDYARIGQDVFASSFTCAINALGPWVRVREITVNDAASQTVGIGQIPTLGTVTVDIT